MARLLNPDPERAAELGGLILDSLEETGYDASETIPGLLWAIIMLAEFTPIPDQALDEASSLLADGFQ